MQNNEIKTKSVDFRRIVWAEMWQAKFNEEYLKEYIDRKRRLNVELRRAYWVIAMVGLFNIEHRPVLSGLAYLIIIILSLTDLLNKFIFPDNDSIKGLEYCHTFYNSYAPDIMEVWIKMEDDIWDESKAVEVFYTVKKTESQVNYIINDLLNKPSRKTKKTAAESTTAFFKSLLGQN